MRRFRDLDEFEQHDAVEAVLGEYRLAFIEQAKREAAAENSNISRRRREKRIALAAFSARVRFDEELRDEFERKARMDARQSWFPARLDRLVELPYEHQVGPLPEGPPSNRDAHPWAKLTVARQVGGECPVCNGRGRQTSYRFDGTVEVEGKECRACRGEGCFQVPRT